MADAGPYHERAAEARRLADLENLPNARLKHLAAAEAWQAMALRMDRFNAAAAQKAAAKVEAETCAEGGQPTF